MHGWYIFFFAASKFYLVYYFISTSLSYNNTVYWNAVHMYQLGLLGTNFTQIVVTSENTSIYVQLIITNETFISAFAQVKEKRYAIQYTI